MKNLLLTFDVEEFSLPRVLYNLNLNKKELEISYKGLNKLLKILNKYKAKATFFTTAFFAKSYPKLIKKLSKTHEVALHGLYHTDNYSVLSKQEAYKKIKEAKQILEKIINKKILGFRAPLFSPPNYDILKKLKFKYDSSLNPIFLPGNYNNFFKKRKIHKKQDVFVLPISATPLLRLPLSWIFFRNFGLIYAKICTKLCLLDQKYIMLLFHPWEFINLNHLKIGKLIKRNTGEKLIKMLDLYLEWCNKNNIKNSTIKDYLFFRK